MIFDIDFYRNVFDFSATASALFTITGECVLANHSFRVQLGYPVDAPSESIRLLDIFEDGQEAENLVAEIRTRNVVRNHESELYSQTRHKLTALLSARLFSYQHQDYLQISFMDASRQKDLQRALRGENARIISLMENLSVGLFFVNRKGLLSNINRTLGLMLGIDEDRLIGHAYQELLAAFLRIAEEPEIIQQRFKEATQHIENSLKLHFTSNELVTHHYELVFFQVHDQAGAAMGWGGLLQDITEMKQQADWKLELLSILAHDIRSPLAALKGHVNVLKENYEHWSDDLTRGFLNEIDQSVDRLARQVDRNLALTRVEGGELGLRPQLVDISEVLMQSVDRAINAKAGVDLKIEVPDGLPKVRADFSRLEEVFINLLDNAVRYSPAEKSIHIKIQVENNWLVCSIRDRGKGIPLEKQKIIFDKYIHEEEGGTGLGLYICRKIIEAHGGQIKLKSPPDDANYGTEFTFYLPVAYTLVKEESESNRTKRKPAKAITGQKILVVEDEIDFQLVLQNILTEEGYQVSIASNGNDALDILQAQPQDLVLLDWMLPGMNGLSICRSIRRWSTLPVIVITACSVQEELITALDAGADDVIIKPFDRQELLARIRAILRRGEEWHQASKMEQFAADGLLIDFGNYEAWRDGVKLDLTPIEFDLLSYFARHKKQVVTHDQLLKVIDMPWGASSRNAIFTYVSRLRAKLEPDPRMPRFIVTRWGLGYEFMPKA